MASSQREVAAGMPLVRTRKPMEQTPDLGAQKTILVVDDNHENLQFVSKFLASSAFNVLTAANGQDALQQAKAYKSEIHLLLTDFEMPGMSGIDLATKLTLERPRIQVLLMSGFNGGMLVLNEGWHFLAKPFIPSQLRALIVGLVSPAGKSKF
jgi:CheY-like chemotaxis protein